MNVRAQAISCTVKKTSYRQSKDGLVVSFLIHHAEMPPSLATAELGTPYLMALVEVDDNDQPKKPAPEFMPDEPIKPRVRVAADKRLAQRAGILCADPVFQRFLTEEQLIAQPSETLATVAVRQFCEVESRAELLPNTPAAERWDSLYGKFVAWRQAP